MERTVEPIANPALMSVKDYLRSEASGNLRHEFIGGRIHAMAGGSERHNLIAGNVFAALHGHLQGGPCRAYMADFKVRLEINREEIFYYPDVMVNCQRVGVEEFYLRFPCLIVEVLSPSTEMIDRREKLLNYPQINTLDEYVLVAQDTMEVTIHRREQRWAPEILTNREAVADFQSIKLSMQLSLIYSGLF